MALQVKESLDHIFLQLKSKNEDKRYGAALELHDLVVAAARELPTNQFQAYYNSINTRISALVVASTDPSEKIGGIIAIERLISIDVDDASQRTTRFANGIRAALRSNDNKVLIYAARALGHLATPGGAFTAELVESEVQSALEWLQTERQETRRFAAVLVIRELARNSPTLLYAFVPQIFDCIWIALRDGLVLIRETAGEAAGACFSIITARDTQVRTQWFSRIYDEALMNLKSKNPNHIHGAFLVLKELLSKGGMFMNKHFNATCDITLRLKDHQDPFIHATVVPTIPILAAYDPPLFVRSYLHKFMTFLQGQLKDDTQRNAAFIAIGKIAHAVGSAISTYLDGILVFVREGLSVKARKKSDTEEGPVFQCISMLSIAVGMALTKYMDALLDPMFACGLSPSLTQALVDMAHYVTPVKPQIQEKLLDLLSIVLSGHPFKPLGCPRDRTPIVPAFAKDFNFAAPRPAAEIELALSTLGSFDFAEHVLNEFVRDVALSYTDSDKSRIRKQAALTCCQLFVEDPIIFQTSYHSIRVVSDVLERLLIVAVADPDPDIRRTVFTALEMRFDKHLAKPENVRSLFLGVTDPEFEVREAAIIIIGRLTAVNPAHVFPSLRKLLINLITGLQSSDDPKNQEDNAKLIGLVIGNASKLAKPYCKNLVTVLLPKAQSTNPAVAATTLRALGQLATVGGTDLVPHIHILMPTIISALQDATSNRKREAALFTLGQLASNTAYVIKPYEEYPQLLGIMISIIEGEAQGSLRKLTINLMGILGALDPYRYQQIRQKNPDKDLSEEEDVGSDVSLIIQGMTPANEDYYPKIVFHTLMHNVLRDPSLSQYHTSVIEAIVLIFKTLGLKCIPYLAQIIPSFIAVINNSPSNRLDAYFNHLAQLVTVVRIHIRNYVGPLIKLIEDFWSADTRTNLATILSLVEALAKAMGNEFKDSIKRILPLLLSVLVSGRPGCEKVLHTLLVFGQDAEERMHLIIPVLVRMFLKPINPLALRKSAIDTIGKISKQVNISDYASTIIHPFTEIFELSPKEPLLSKAALDCICAFIFQLGRDYLLYAGTVKKALDKSGVSHANYDLLVSKLQKGEPLPQDLSSDENYGTLSDESQLASADHKKLPVNQEHLKNAWDASQKSTPEDWQEWMRRFSVELLRESPSHALRACASLASLYQPLAKDLFNSAFASCWPELYDQYQEELLLSLEMALASSNIPPDILQVLLNLCEFMEHDDRALPLDIRRLGTYAAKNHAFAKALHYKELEFEEDKTPGPIEALISINNQLQQSDAAVGILRTAQSYRDFDLKETWYEKLERWDDALAAYKRREKVEPGSFEVTMGKMRCLHALGEWDDLSNLAEQKWNLASSDHKRALAPLAAAAAWGLGRWELMENYLQGMKSHSVDKAFFGAILALHRNQFPQAANFIEKAREGLDTELTALLGESYNRAYIVVVRVQILAELEEIITYKKSEDNPDKQEIMRKTWNKRLKGCQKNHEVWQRMLKVRALVLTPRENIDMWIKFANLCRKSGRMGLAEKSLELLKNPGQGGNAALLQNGGPGSDGPYGSTGIPEVMYAQLKYKWALASHPKTLERLEVFTADLSNRLMIHNNSSAANGPIVLGNLDPTGMTGQPRRDAKGVRKLLAKCYVKQGEWITTLNKGDWQNEQVHDIIDAYAHATTHNNTWYKAWHSWALANFQVVTAADTDANDKKHMMPMATVINHVVPAIRGFFKSIGLTSTSSLQDTLRLLTLWFKYGHFHEVNTAVLQGFPEVSIDVWLEVIPQLIARIAQGHNRVRETIHRLLIDIGRVHPQALVYPLTVTMKSTSSSSATTNDRARWARYIMNKLRDHSPHLVADADTVANELIRIAVLWHEQWHEGLEEASRLWFGDRNLEGMFATLKPLHDDLNKGAETLREMSFVQAFKHELDEAYTWCEKFRQTGDDGDLNQAWDLYYNVFKKIQRQLPGLLSLDLSYVSPKLQVAKNLSLAVPGTYRVGKPIITIASFQRIVIIIPSKQRPRKMTMYGSDGRSYEFCLKGHEDIRQDERVMQLFGLVNTLLTNDSESFKRHLNIQPYPAIPLSQSSGLLGWVPNSETMHNLIKDYREQRRILLNIEHRIMLQMAPDFDNLTLMQKVEVFSYAMDNTTGKDLYRVLWLKSKSSEAWLERRTTYTRSLATMSMVGYILGLGDRHPSNLLIDKNTGQVVHIDFGDCFEVAMHREKYPERVPFRLTRMLTFAMEVSNIDGSYKISCEAVMRVIRSNRESIMAVLEAFIHDPLLTWRLTAREEQPPEPNFPSERRNSIAQDPRNPNQNQSTMQAVQQQQQQQQQATTTATDAGPGGNEFAVGRPSSAGRPGRRLSILQAGPVDLEQDVQQTEVQNARAVQVLARVRQKLVGRDFKAEEELGVDEQVSKLIRQATNVENLCQHYIGWCSFW